MGLLAEQDIRTGKLERQNPLPIGRYWIDVFSPKTGAWQAWLAKAGTSVKVIATEHYDSFYEETTVPFGGDEYPARDWILFEVLSPVEWSKDTAIQLGWPNIASQSVQSSDDTVDKPTVGPFGNIVGPGEKDKWSWVPWAVGGTIVVVGILGIASFAKSARGIL